MSDETRDAVSAAIEHDAVLAMAGGLSGLIRLLRRVDAHLLRAAQVNNLAERDVLLLAINNALTDLRDDNDLGLVLAVVSELTRADTT